LPEPKRWGNVWVAGSCWKYAKRSGTKSSTKVYLPYIPMCRFTAKKRTILVSAYSI